MVIHYSCLIKFRSISKHNMYVKDDKIARNIIAMTNTIFLLAVVSGESAVGSGLYSHIMVNTAIVE